MDKRLPSTLDIGNSTGSVQGLNVVADKSGKGLKMQEPKETDEYCYVSYSPLCLSGLLAILVMITRSDKKL